MSLPAPPTYEDPASLTSLRPYLTLPYLTSLTWLAYPILSMLFVAFRLQLSLSSAEHAVADAKSNILASCQAAQQSATSTASLPRYMAAGTNKQIVDAVNATMNGARDALILSLTAMESIINFFIDGYRATFLCFLELVIRGGLSVLIFAVKELQQSVQVTMAAISSSIKKDIAGANSAISSAVNGINKSPFGPHIHLPQFSIASVDLLNNVTLSSSFETALTNLNSSIPSVKALRGIIRGFVDTPFELLKKEINDTFQSLSYNGSVLPVPQMNSVSFCNQLDTGIIDKLGLEMIKIAQIGTILLIILAVLLLVFHGFLEWYKWRSLRKSLKRTRSAWSTDPTIYHVDPVDSTPSLQMTDHHLLTLHAISTHPLLSCLANAIAVRCHLTPSQFIHLQFFFHYIFHPPALACFIIGFFGFLSVEFQLITLEIVQNKFSHQASASSSSFTNGIAASINAVMRNESLAYANAVNAQLATTQNFINHGLFGWVNGTTTTLNNTIVTFYSDVQNAIHLVLGGTPFDEPAQEFVRCMIGSKIQSLELALTFLNTNLHVTLPVINETALLLSPAQLSEAAQPISSAAVGSGGSGTGGIIGRVVTRYISDLQKERVMFAIFMALWGVVVLCALCIIFWHSYGKFWLHMSERRRWQREQRGNFDSVFDDKAPSLPAPSPQFAKTEKERELVSFTPLSSPDRTSYFTGLKKRATGIHWPRAEGWTTSGRTSQTSRDDLPKLVEPTKLMAVGRKALGRERLVPDQDTEAQSGEDHSDKDEDKVEDKVEVIKDKVEVIKDKVEVIKDKVEVIKDKVEVIKDNGKVFEDRGEVIEIAWKEERDPWWRRLWNRWGPIEDDLRDQAPLLVQRRTGASNLTIETNGIQAKSQRDTFSFLQDGSQAEEIVHEPASAWSISPAARPTPWIRPLSALIPLRQKPKILSNAVIPQLTKAVPTRPGPPSQRLSIPIHYGFVRPASVSRGTPLSPVLPTSAVPNTNSTFMLLPEIVEDPFATCFDDDYRVRPEPQAKRIANPFGDSMGSPRAV